MIDKLESMLLFDLAVLKDLDNEKHLIEKKVIKQHLNYIKYLKEENNGK